MASVLEEEKEKPKELALTPISKLEPVPPSSDTFKIPKKSESNRNPRKRMSEQPYLMKRKILRQMKQFYKARFTDSI